MDIDGTLTRLASKITDANREVLENTCRIDSGELFAYQTLQSDAYASGRISLDTANFLYRTFGQSAETFNRAELPNRLLALSIIGMLAK